MLATCYHVIILLYYGLVLYYIANMKMPKIEDEVLIKFGEFRGRFLTGWNLMLQVLVFSLCVIEDFLRLTPENFIKSTKYFLNRLKDHIILTMSFPITFLVFTVFWSHFLYDRSLIYPESLDLILPVWMNHILHTAIAPIIAIELLIARHYYPKRKKAFFMTASYLIIYSIVYISTFFLHGVWLYPIFGLMTWYQVIIYGLSLYLLCFLYYIIGEKIHYLKWGPPVKITKAQIKKKEK